MKFLQVILLAFLSINCTSNTTDSKVKMLEKTISQGRDVLIENETFNEPVDFTKMTSATLVNKGLYNIRIVSSITFSNCTFNAEVTGYKKDDSDNRTTTSFQSNLSFIGCTFNDDVNFRGVSVLGKAVFSGSFFEKTANFEEASFQQLAFFNNCSFHEELRFQNAFFMQRANFINAQFNSNGSFQGSTFNSTAQFSNTRFYGYADFSLVNWKENVFFNYAELADRSIFNSSKFWGITDFLSVSFGSTEIKNCEFFGILSFDKSTISNQLTFTNNFFIKKEADLSVFEEEKVIQE